MIQYNDLVLSGSLNVKDGITGSLAGTASYALNSGTATVGGSNYTVQFNSGSSVSGSIGLQYIYERNALVHGIDQDVRINTVTQQIALGAVKLGYNTRTTGTGSLAQGYQTNALGNFSHAEGKQNNISSATGEYSHTEGVETSAYGTGSHSEGFRGGANGDYSHTEGNNSVANGAYAHAEGTNSSANGPMSHAEGWYTNTRATASHAEGANTTTYGNFSHAEGHNTITVGAYSHAEGLYTIASASYSHAEGESTITIGLYSHAAGLGTISSGSHQNVVGRYNKQGNDTALFIIGNGANNSDRRDLAIFNINGVEILKPVTASLISGSLFGTASFAATASNAFSASYAVTASNINTLEQDVYMTGSWEMLGNLTVRGTASFQYTTASQTLINQNTITVFGSGSVLPQAGLIAADTASVYTSGSWLWDFPGQYWFTTASISASSFNGTASFASTYPTREFTVTPATASWICDHNLGTRWVQVTCWDTNTNLVILPDEIEALSTSSVKISFTAPVEGVARIS